MIALDAAGPAHRRVRGDLDAALGAAPRTGRRDLGPGVEDPDPGAGVGEVERGGVGRVVGGGDDDVAAGEHAVAVQQVAGGGGEHDAGPVVVLEDDGALDGAGGDDDAGGADAVDALAGAARRGAVAEMVGAPLEREHEAVLVVPERGGALQVGDLGVRGQLGDDVRDHLPRRPAVDPLGAGEGAARRRAVVDEDDAVPGAGRVAGGGEPGRAGADDEDVARGCAGGRSGRRRGPARAGPGRPRRARRARR